MVTAVPLVTVTDPAEVMLTSDGAPLLAVDVLTGVVTAVEIVLCAAAGLAANRMTGVKQVEASSTRIRKSLFFERPLGRRRPFKGNDGTEGAQP
jgi:hypothetical protein